MKATPNHIMIERVFKLAEKEYRMTWQSMLKANSYYAQTCRNIIAYLLSLHMSIDHISDIFGLDTIRMIKVGKAVVSQEMVNRCVLCK